MAFLLSQALQEIFELASVERNKWRTRRWDRLTLTKARDIPNLSRGLLQIATAWVKCTIRCKLWALLCIEIVSVNADAAKQPCNRILRRPPHKEGVGCWASRGTQLRLHGDIIENRKVCGYMIQVMYNRHDTSCIQSA